VYLYVKSLHLCLTIFKLGLIVEEHVKKIPGKYLIMLGLRLDSMILKVFSKLNDSIILYLPRA